MEFDTIESGWKVWGIYVGEEELRKGMEEDRPDGYEDTGMKIQVGPTGRKPG